MNVAAEFVAKVAALERSGDRVNRGIFIAQRADAIATVNQIIDEARAIVAMMTVSEHQFDRAQRYVVVIPTKLGMAWEDSQGFDECDDAFAYARAHPLRALVIDTITKTIVEVPEHECQE